MNHSILKKLFPLFLAAAVVVLNCTTAFATYSSSNSGDLSKNAGVVISGDDIQIDEDNVEIAGSITSEDGTVTFEGVRMEYREIGDWTTGSSGAIDFSGEGDSEGDSEEGESADSEAIEDADAEAAEGESADSEAAEAPADESESEVQPGQSGAILTGVNAIVVGGSENHFTAPDGKDYNTVIELWADDADVDNALSPGLKRSALTNDVETYPGVGLAAHADNVLIDNVYILTDGAARAAIMTGDSVTPQVNTVVRNSTLVSLAEGWIFPAHICLLRNARTALLTSCGDTWFYNTSVYSDGWGCFSMEAADGIDNFVVVNCYAENYTGGYGFFTLGMAEDFGFEENHVRIYGTKVISPQYGWIYDDAGIDTIGSMADIIDDPEAMSGYEGEITPDMYVTEDGGCFFAGNNNAAVFTFDLYADPGLIGRINIKNSTLTTAEEDLVREDGTLAENVMDYSGASIVNDDAISGGMAYFGTGYVRGATIWQRGANADVTMQNVNMRSSTGVLIHSTIDYTNFDLSNSAGREARGIKFHMTDMELQGDIVHDDYQRKMYLTLDNTTLEGAVNWYTVEQYNDRVAAYIDAHWAEAEALKAEWEAENGEGSSLLSTKENIFSRLALEETYDETLGGLEMTLENGSSWIVTGESTLSKLVVSEGCTIQGTMTVDGTETEIVPGTYEGAIIISPAEGAIAISPAA